MNLIYNFVWFCLFGGFLKFDKSIDYDVCTSLVIISNITMYYNLTVSTVFVLFLILAYFCNQSFHSNKYYSGFSLGFKGLQVLLEIVLLTCVFFIYLVSDGCENLKILTLVYLLV